jgi:hypothetical protein
MNLLHPSTFGPEYVGSHEEDEEGSTRRHFREGDVTITPGAAAAPGVIAVRINPFILPGLPAHSARVING